MNTYQSLEKKFSRMSTLLKYVQYFYIFLFIAASILSVFLIHYIDIDPKIFFTDGANVVLFIFIVGVVGMYFFIVFYILELLQQLVTAVKKHQIFTTNNRKIIQKLFIIFSVFLWLLFLVVSGGILCFFIAIFLWILYEFVLLAFDYKAENDELKAENNLTI